MKKTTNTAKNMSALFTVTFLIGLAFCIATGSLAAFGIFLWGMLVGWLVREHKHLSEMEAEANKSTVEVRFENGYHIIDETHKFSREQWDLLRELATKRRKKNDGDTLR